jgi:hypothetical protein
MSEPHIKQVVLTGGAAVEFTGGSVKKERKSTRSKKAQNGGSTTAAASSSVPPLVPSMVTTLQQGAMLSAPTPVGPPPRITGADLSQVAHRLLPPSTNQLRPIQPPHQQQQQQQQQQAGGADTKIIKVELKKKQQTKKVQLQPKKVDAPVKGTLHGAKKAQTKKVRKITLGIKALHKRMDRAKKMTRKAKEMPLEKLREHLIQKKLIKPTSKAPESVLRQIAADAQIVAGKAL